MSEYRLSAMDPDKIDELRFKAFKTNSQEDKMAYYREASAYFQDRHVRALIRAEPTHAQIMADPNAVHINILRGSIAKPTVEQIIHIYGADILRAALPPTQAQIMADERVQAMVRLAHEIANNKTTWNRLHFRRAAIVALAALDPKP